MVSSWVFVGGCTDRFLMCTPYCTLDRRRFGMRMIGMLLTLSASCVFPSRLHACLTPTYDWLFTLVSSRSGELRTQKLKSHLVRTQSLNVLPIKPGVSQYIAIHATLTARDFFFAYFYPSSPFTCIFSKTFHDFFPALAVANTGSCVGPQNEIGHPAGCRFS